MPTVLALIENESIRIKLSLKQTC